MLSGSRWICLNEERVRKQFSKVNGSLHPYSGALLTLPCCLHWGGVLDSLLLPFPLPARQGRVCKMSVEVAGRGRRREHFWRADTVSGTGQHSLFYSSKEALFPFSSWKTWESEGVVICTVAQTASVESRLEPRTAWLQPWYFSQYQAENQVAIRWKDTVIWNHSSLNPTPLLISCVASTRHCPSWKVSISFKRGWNYLPLRSTSYPVAF